MTWQGVPFRLLDHKTADYISIALSSIPKISLDSPPDYTGPAITALAALIGGLIPSLIAWRTFKRNAEHTKQERIEQQDFLRQERAAQQQFLKDERAAQNSALELDRKVQLEIASQNFNMQVLSANRQAWINEFRTIVAEYASLLPVHLSKMADYSIALKGLTTYLNVINSPSVSHVVRDETFNSGYSKSSDKFEQERSLLNAYEEKNRILEAKIKMMLNPIEEEFKDFMLFFSKVANIKKKLNDDVDLKEFGNIFTEMINVSSEVLALTQIILKKEWIRVKKGA